MHCTMTTEEEFPTFTDCESDTSSICSVNFSDCTETDSVTSLSGIDFSDCSDTGSELFSTSSEHDCSLLSNSLPCSTASSWHNVFGKEIHHCFVCMFNEFKGHLFIHEHL